MFNILHCVYKVLDANSKRSGTIWIPRVYALSENTKMKIVNDVKISLYKMFNVSPEKKRIEYKNYLSNILNDKGQQF